MFQKKVRFNNNLREFNYFCEIMSQEQPNNPLHGIKLATILEQLFLEYGWEELGDILNINAFKNNPTYKSSLKFLIELFFNKFDALFNTTL